MNLHAIMTQSKNSASPTSHFGHYKGIAGFKFTVKDVKIFRNQEKKWFTGKKHYFPKCESQEQGNMFHQCCFSKYSSNLLLYTNIYLKESTPFFVALTKNGNLSVLVMSTSPPLLSMAPKWIAALQILDC